jgi:hypothetical protein
VSFTAEQLEAKLGDRLPAGLTSLRVETNPSGRVAAVVATGTGGETRIPGTTVRFALGLRSTWFTIQSPALEPSARRIEYGRPVTLRGQAPGENAVTLEQRPAGEAWQRLGVARTGPRGAFAFVHRPRATTAYRMRLGRRAGPAVTVTVAPALTLRAERGARALVGAVRPRLAGRPVTVERRAADGWRAVATGTVTPRGTFRIALELRPGVYRARVPRTDTLSTGVSPHVRVVPA